MAKGFLNLRSPGMNSTRGTWSATKSRGFIPIAPPSATSTWGDENRSNIPPYPTPLDPNWSVSGIHPDIERQSQLMEFAQGQQAQAQRQSVEEQKKYEEYIKWVEANPQAYYSSQTSGLSGAMKDYFADMYDALYKEYMGSLASGALSGVKPDMTWKEWLDQFDFEKEYKTRVPYYYRGGREESRIAPIGGHFLKF